MIFIDRPAGRLMHWPTDSWASGNIAIKLITQSKYEAAFICFLFPWQNSSDQKELRGRRGLIWLPLLGQSQPTLQELKQKLKQKSPGTLTASRRLLSGFAYTSQPHLPRDGAAHGGLGPSSAIISLDNLCQNSQGPVWPKQYFIWGPHFSVDSKLYQMESNN